MIALQPRYAAAGVDPYRYRPTAPELAALRDEWLFPGGQPRLNHGRFAVLQLLLPPAAALDTAALRAGAAPLVRRRADPDRPWRAALVMTGVTFLVTGPSYPWYPLLLVALAALHGSWQWLAVAAAAYPAYFADALDVRHETMQQWAYGLALVVVAAALARARPWTGKPSGGPRWVGQSPPDPQRRPTAMEDEADEHRGPRTEAQPTPVATPGGRLLHPRHLMPLVVVFIAGLLLGIGAMGMRGSSPPDPTFRATGTLQTLPAGPVDVTAETVRLGRGFQGRHEHGGPTSDFVVAGRVRR